VETRQRTFTMMDGIEVIKEAEAQKRHGGHGGQDRDKKRWRNGPSPDDECSIHGEHLERRSHRWTRTR
jgi:hypothetical protein